MNIGILGVGVIGRAIVEGLCYDDDQTHRIFLSPRSQKNTNALAKKYNQVIKCQDNQSVIDQSDIIFISVLPNKGLEILEGLSFNKNHHVINLMADKKLDEIRAVIGETASLSHVIPLSFIAKRRGPIALYPKNDMVENLMSQLGHVISVDTYEKIKSMATISGLMTSYYGLLNDIIQWGVKNNLSQEEAKDYTSLFFESLSWYARQDNVETLAREMTPGGLNEMALKYIDQENGFEPWLLALEPIFARLNKK